MNKKLPCAVVRDLLPSYVEKLTEPETTTLVQQHLSECEDCSKRYRGMAAEEGITDAKQEKQIDYLKQVRRKSRKKILTAVCSVAAVLLLIVCSGLYVVGWAGDPLQIHYKAHLADGGDSLELHIFLSDSALALGKESVRTAEDTVTVGIRQVLSSPLNRFDARIVRIPLQGIHQVMLMGQLVWQDGLVIEQKTVNLWENRTPYVGSMWKVQKMAGQLPLPPIPYGNRLHTAAEPYGWTLDFREPLAPAYQEWMHQIMPLAIATVDNLGCVMWTWPGMTEAEEEQSTVTLAEVNGRLGELTEQYNQKNGTEWKAMSNIKDYVQNPYTLQQLMNILEVN